MELRVDALADEIAAIADEAIPTDLRGSDASAWVQQQRLQVDAKKWLACKLFPACTETVSGSTLQSSKRVSITAALEAAQRRVYAIEAPPAEPLADSRSRA